MIEFTIKTLDSNNHPFAVEDETTVLQLKEKVREALGIDISQQRLIFCGRVLQDEKKLAECDVNGKVIHLVQRMPPSQEERLAGHSASNSASEPANNGAQQQIRRIMAMTGLMEEQTSTSPTTSRLEFIRRMIAEIKTSLANLRAHVENENISASPGAFAEAMENEPSSSAPHEEAEPVPEENEDTPYPFPRQQTSRRRLPNTARAIRARNARPRDLGLLLEELESLLEEFQPFRTIYISTLRSANTVDAPQLTEEQRQREQRTVDMISDLMHSFSHAFHAISDINFQVGQRNARLTSEAPVLRHPIPMQAHINVVQPNRRQQQQQANAATGGSAGSGAATSTQTSEGGQDGNPPAPPAGRNTTQPTVNINIQPDPITYQVEIETRMPVAFALENALLNGLTTANQQPPTDQRAGQPPNQAPPSQNAPPPNNAQPQNQNQQPNRRQVLFDFENLFRGMGQGGVEVVMSMEEIPHGGQWGSGGTGAAAGAGANGPNAAGATPAAAANFDGGVYLGAMPWGGPPSADLLQNIVSSVIRQGLVPGVEGVLAAHLPHAHTHTHTHAQAQAQPPNDAAQQQRQANGQTRPSIHLRRATATTRAQTLTLANFVYDRFLACDSHHARRRLQQLREQAQQRARPRPARNPAQSIESLREHINEFTQGDIETMQQLLNAAPSQQSLLTALLVVIARQQFLPGSVSAATGDPAQAPSELQAVRTLLRNYLEQLMQRTGANGDSACAGSYLVQQYQDFIRRMGSVTPLRREVDVFATLQALVRSRLPAVLVTVMADPSGDNYETDFYGAFHSLFVDFCALLSYCCCWEGGGLRAIHSAFMDDVVRPLEEPVRQMLRRLAAAVLTHADRAVPSRTNRVLKYVRSRSPFSPEVVQPNTHAESPMETTPPISPTCSVEPMYTTPPATPAQLASVGTLPTPPAPAAPAVPSAPMEPEEEDLSPAAVAASLPPGPANNPATANATTPIPKIEITTTTPTSERNGVESPRFVPPVLLLQHLGEEWVPVLTRDQQLQAERPAPEPYSDAYLSGMPARKRRCVRQARPPASLEPLIDVSIRDANLRAAERAAKRTAGQQQATEPATVKPAGGAAAGAAATTADPEAGQILELRRAFRETIRALARSRASASDEYEPQNFASAERFLLPRNTPGQPEGDKECK